MYILTTLSIIEFKNSKDGKRLEEMGLEKFNQLRLKKHLEPISLIDWNKRLEGLTFERTRTVGFFRTFKAAENVIKNNSGDISELNYYNAAVIEKVKFGLYPIPKEEFWYLMETKKEDNNYVYNYKKLDKSPFPGLICWY